MMSFWKLYRRSKNPDHLTSQPETFDITKGVDGSIWMSLYPGWHAFDYKAQVADEEDGSLGKGKIQVVIDGVVRAEFQASWPWTRHYMFLPKNEPGKHYKLRFQTTGYKPEDEAAIRYQNTQYYTPMSYVKYIEKANLRPQEEMISIDILAGFTRYQSSGPNGTQIETTIVIKGTAGWRDFMANISDYFIMEGEEGFYGGVILPQSVQYKRVAGDVYLVDCTMQSSSVAGKGSF